MTAAAPPGFWKTVRLLLNSSSRRSRGRQQRQQQLLNSRGSRSTVSWASWFTVLAVLLSAVLHLMAGAAVIEGVREGQRLDERQDKVFVSSDFLDDVNRAEKTTWASSAVRDASLANSVAQESARIAKNRGGDAGNIAIRLHQEIARSGSANLALEPDEASSLPEFGHAGPSAALLGSVVGLWWFAMLVCQGEGLELDLQRRRHPMWEWLFSHPVNAGAVFLAEMLAPLAANPMLWSAPLFTGFIYTFAYDLGQGAIAAVLIGVPVAVAACCLGKAVEIGALLRLAPRNRGAVIGLVGWFGYASLMAMFVMPMVLDRIVPALARPIGVIAQVPAPWLGLFVGLGSDGKLSFLRGVAFCWAACGIMIALATVFCARSLRQGLAGAFAADAVVTHPGAPTRFGREPLFRKEYLWFVRDRSAIVQTILIPLTVAGAQLLNFRRLLVYALESWNFLCGAAIFVGTYFLWVLGPRSLLSEGPALWIALTWPRGLESVLKAKAWLWSIIATGLVWLVLLIACLVYPHDIWKIVLVAIGWYLFARGMAEKSVTMVTVASESGEVNPQPRSRRWGAQLGMLTFAIGVSSQQWHLAVVGIVYSWITAAAMWENLRARLPYLYDPWSEILPEPPTLLHAMVAISVLIECASLVSAAVIGMGGREMLPVAQSLGYAICAVGTGIGTTRFLNRREVSPGRIWVWRDSLPIWPESWLQRYVAPDRVGVGWLLAGVCGGLALGCLAHGYLIAMAWIPSIADQIHAARTAMDSMPGLRISYAVVAIGFAPLAEEYLFRALVYRTLDRHWGGWRAVAGAAAFFAIYHPPLSWLPVAALGAINCMLFKRSRRLAPAVLLHMVYNTVVIAWS